jgi:hypothetical protein
MHIICCVPPLKDDPVAVGDFFPCLEQQSLPAVWLTWTLPVTNATEYIIYYVKPQVVLTVINVFFYYYYY